MAAPAHTFGRKERLKSRDRIDRLFAQGKGGLVHPLRYIVLEEDAAAITRPGSRREGAAVSVLVSVPKKKHKRAVRRNLLKRRIREAYRLTKEPLLTMQQAREGKMLSLGLLYISDEAAGYGQIENAVKKIIAKITRRD